jgi:membrane protein DedA with SNARE-associated domain/rhodanese-related sulfurtransferase
MSTTISEITQFLVDHGGSVLFAVVLLEQAGLPLPAAPWLLAAGALCANGRLNPVLALAATVMACLIADGVWFQLGRHHGSRVLNLLCRISLEPDSCVRRTQNVFTRYGMRGVLVAKFLPGIGTLVPPLAGNAGVSAPRFFIFDGLGSLLYGGCYLLVGFLFNKQLEKILATAGSLGSSALEVIAALVAVYIGVKYFQRRRLLRDLRMAKITVDELLQMQEAGEKFMILDVRSLTELETNPAMIRGALHITMEEMEHRQQEIPRDRDIILYCSCPNEVSSARMALLLHRKGIKRVRPLLGGMDAWRERNYPTELRVVGVGGTSGINLAREETAL